MAIVTVLIRKVSDRKFVAGVKYNGKWVLSEDKENVTAGQVRSAITKLEEKLKVMGCKNIPQWKVEFLHDRPDTAQAVIEETETETPEPFETTTEDDMLPKLAPTDNGWTTPNTDMQAWKDGYMAAVRACTGFEVSQLRNLSGEQGKQFRTDITKVMRAVGLIGPWDQNGEEVPWHFVARVYDPTTFGAKPGDGDRRVMKDINGLSRRVATGELVDFSQRRQPAPEPVRVNGKFKVFGKSAAPAAPVEDSAETVEAPVETPVATASKFKVFGAKPVQSSTPVAYQYLGGTEEQRALAYANARKLRDEAVKKGQGPEIVRVWGMIGMVVALRAMGLPPHIEFETELKSNGVTEDYLKDAAKRAA